MKPEILSSLRCPVTASELNVADDAVVDRINSLIAAGKASAHDGGAVEASVDGGLLNSERSCFVPLRDGIYCFNLESLIRFQSN